MSPLSDQTTTTTTTNNAGIVKSSEYTETKSLLSSLYGDTVVTTAPPPDNDPTCVELPRIRPDGVFFLQSQIEKHSSHPDISPSFYIGSKIKDVMYHMYVIYK
jgi:hypothetical protein